MLIDYSEVVANDYRDNNYIAGLLKICLEEEGFDVFLVALREIAKARGGMTWLSKTTGLSRESLYRSLSQGARPEFETIYSVVRALGLSLEFTPTNVTLPEVAGTHTSRVSKTVASRKSREPRSRVNLSTT